MPLIHNTSYRTTFSTVQAKQSETIHCNTEISSIEWRALTHPQDAAPRTDPGRNRATTGSLSAETFCKKFKFAMRTSLSPGQILVQLCMTFRPSSSCLCKFPRSLGCSLHIFFPLRGHRQSFTFERDTASHFRERFTLLVQHKPVCLSLSLSLSLSLLSLSLSLSPSPPLSLFLYISRTQLSFPEVVNLTQRSHLSVQRV